METQRGSARGRGRPRKHFANLSQRKNTEETVFDKRVLRIHIFREDLERLRSKRLERKHLLSKRLSNSGSSSPVHSPKSHSFKKGLLRTRNSSSRDSTPVKSKSSVSSRKLSSRSSNRRERTVEKQKTLNKTISKDKFKIKLFSPKVRRTDSMKVVNNGDKVRNGVSKLNIDSKYKPVKPGQRFYLKFAQPKPIEQGRLGYDFHSLVADVKTLQLPGPTWKIKVIIKHNRIAALIFTNKMDLERSVSFNSDSDKYDIVLDNKPILLLGSPGKVSHSTDIEVLLNIVQNLESGNPMIMYK